MQNRNTERQLLHGQMHATAVIKAEPISGEAPKSWGNSPLLHAGYGPEKKTINITIKLLIYFQNENDI